MNLLKWRRPVSSTQTKRQYVYPKVAIPVSTDTEFDQRLETIFEDITETQKNRVRKLCWDIANKAIGPNESYPKGHVLEGTSLTGINHHKRDLRIKVRESLGLAK